VERVDHILAILFGEEIFFANAGIFRREMHDALAKLPETRYVIVDAVAIADIDFTGMTTLSRVVADLAKDTISISFARANDRVQERLSTSHDPALSRIMFFDSTDAAASAALATEASRSSPTGEAHS
jgi:MFS superfamily sulfate permease-like transporter